MAAGLWEHGPSKPGKFTKCARHCNEIVFVIFSFSVHTLGQYPDYFCVEHLIADSVEA